MPGIVEIVGTLFGLGGGGGSSSKPATPTTAQTDASALKTKQTQETALSQQFPNIQSQTGGSLSPDAWLRLSEILSGQSGDAGIGSAGQDLIAKMFSQSETASAGSPANSGLSSSSGLTLQR